jgi:ABC-2 type transport system permease protein
MIITSSLVTDEHREGTLQTVMLQAVRKWKFMLAKYITAILFTLVVIAFMAASTFIMAYGIFGNGDLIVYIDTLNFFEPQDAVNRICLAFASGTVVMVFYAVISVTLAIFIKESAKTWIASALFLILVNLLLKMDFGSELINRFFFAKLVDTWQYFFYYETNWRAVILNNILLLLYIVLFAWIGIFTFQKRDIG